MKRSFDQCLNGDGDCDDGAWQNKQPSSFYINTEKDDPAEGAWQNKLSSSFYMKTENGDTDDGVDGAWQNKQSSSCYMKTENGEPKCPGTSIPVSGAPTLEDTPHRNGILIINSETVGSPSPKTTKYEESRIRIGEDFQAWIPKLISGDDSKVHTHRDKSVLVWRPPPTPLPKGILKKYLDKAKMKNYSEEQALGILLYCKYDVTKAAQELYTYLPDSNEEEEWTIEDRKLFDSAVQFYWKDFQEIRRMLPHKSTRSLISHYYKWKKDKSKNKFTTTHNIKSILRSYNAPAPTSNDIHITALHS